LQEIVAGRDIQCVKVANHNDEDTQNLLKELSLDFIVLGDTRIIRPNILSIPRLGIINVHPGYLPDVRGNNPYIWALYHDLPQGCSVHFIDKDIDTGPLILREKIELEQGSSFPLLMNTLINSCANLLATALNRIEKGNMECQPQADLELMGPVYPTFPLAPPAIKEKAKQILSEGRYKYLIKQ
jgi:methionyl-tRNA formyltransferase